MQRLYCSPECQAAEWPAHKRECKRIQKETTAGAPPAGFLGVLLDIISGKVANVSKEDKWHAHVLVCVTRGDLCALTDDCDRPMLPPLLGLAEVRSGELVTEEIEEAFDAVADGQDDHEALTDELAACAFSSCSSSRRAPSDEEERYP